MEQILFRLHVRSVTVVTALSSSRLRSLIEKVALFNAVVCLFLLVWLHRTYLAMTAENTGHYSNCILNAMNKSGVKSTAAYNVVRVHITTPSFDFLRRMTPSSALTSESGSCKSNSSREEELLHAMLGEFKNLNIQNDSPWNNMLSRISSYTFWKYGILSPNINTSIASNLNLNLNSTDNYILQNRFEDYLLDVAHIDTNQQGSTRLDVEDSRGRVGGSKLNLKSVANKLFSQSSPPSTHTMGDALFDADSYSNTDTDSLATSSDARVFQDEDTHFLERIFASQHVYIFSKEKGFLSLRADLRGKLNVTQLDITIPYDCECFGNPIAAGLIRNVVGYDTILMNWAISAFEGRGHLYNVHSKEVFNLNFAKEFSVDPQGGLVGLGMSTTTFYHRTAFKLGVLLTTSFIFFTTTTLVSFTLRETQERMLKFTFLLQHYIAHQLPYAQLIFTHVVETLVFVPIVVGILFFLFEFFSDQLLAFMVFSTVWVSETYSVVSLRTAQSIKYFPRFFLVYFSLFHIYFFSFPFGFSYLALLISVLFISHSMIYFWSTYEVPALESGLVNAVYPRVVDYGVGFIGDLSMTNLGNRMVGLSNRSNSFASRSVDSADGGSSRSPSLGSRSRSASGDEDRHVNRRPNASSGSNSPISSSSSSQPSQDNANRRAPSSSLPRGQFRSTFPESIPHDRPPLSRSLSNQNLSQRDFRTAAFSRNVELSRRIQQHQMSNAFFGGGGGYWTFIGIWTIIV